MVTLQRVSFPIQKIVERQNSQDRRLQVRSISRTSEIFGGQSLGLYNLSDGGGGRGRGTVSRLEQSSHSRRLMNYKKRSQNSNI